MHVCIYPTHVVDMHICKVNVLTQQAPSIVVECFNGWWWRWGGVVRVVVCGVVFCYACV